MMLFTILGLSPLEWFLFVDLPLSVLLLIIAIPLLVKLYRKRKAENEIQAEDLYYEVIFNAWNHIDEVKIDLSIPADSDETIRKKTPNEKRVETMLSKYGVPYAFLLNKKHTE